MGKGKGTLSRPDMGKEGRGKKNFGVYVPRKAFLYILALTHEGIHLHYHSSEIAAPVGQKSSLNVSTLHLSEVSLAFFLLLKRKKKFPFFLAASERRVREWLHMVGVVGERKLLKLPLTCFFFLSVS